MLEIGGKLSMLHIEWKNKVLDRPQSWATSMDFLQYNKWKSVFKKISQAITNLFWWIFLHLFNPTQIIKVFHLTKLFNQFKTFFSSDSPLHTSCIYWLWKNNCLFVTSFLMSHKMNYGHLFVFLITNLSGIFKESLIFNQGFFFIILWMD
jgi:hypothetical protein